MSNVPPGAAPEGTPSAKKKAWLGAGIVLGAIAAFLAVIPQTMGWAPFVEAGAKQAQEHAQQQLDLCGPIICACDTRGAKRECGVVNSRVALVDGGACWCPQP